MNEQKLHFIQHEILPLLHTLQAGTPAKWGKMNAQQMTEHLSAFFKVSTEKITFPLVTPVDHLPKYREFLYSEIPFRENTKAPSHIIPEEGLPAHYPSLEFAVDKLEKEVNDFFIYFKDDAAKTTLHPVFGDLNFEEWVLLHYKHATHHLRQFGLLDG